MKNRKFLSYIHEHECIIGECCDGPVQAHHLLRPWSGFRGTGMKAGDENCVPLCFSHHHELHMRGDEDAFFYEKSGNADLGRQSSESFWRQFQSK